MANQDKGNIATSGFFQAIDGINVMASDHILVKTQPKSFFKQNEVCKIGHLVNAPAD